MRNFSVALTALVREPFEQIRHEMAKTLSCGRHQIWPVETRIGLLVWTGLFLAIPHFYGFSDAVRAFTTLLRVV